MGEWRGGACCQVTLFPIHVGDNDISDVMRMAAYRDSVPFASSLFHVAELKVYFALYMHIPHQGFKLRQAHKLPAMAGMRALFLFRLAFATLICICLLTLLCTQIVYITGHKLQTSVHCVKWPSLKFSVAMAPLFHAKIGCKWYSLSHRRFACCCKLIENVHVWFQTVHLIFGCVRPLPQECILTL